MTVWDLVIDPILSGPTFAPGSGSRAGPYFGVPVQNYFGWFVTTFVVYLAYRAMEQRVSAAPAGLVTARVAALAVGAYGAMLAAELLSGVLPGGVLLIGPVVMGVPIGLAALRLRLRPAPLAEPPSAGPATAVTSSDPV
jgi:uncharacterized membrane protein